LDSIAFAKSLTLKSIVRSIGSNNSALNYNIEMPFFFNNTNFENARTLIEKEKNSDIFLLKDINDNTDIDTEVDVDMSTTSIFNSESTTLGLTNRNEYFVANTTDASEFLSKCLILDLNNDFI